MAHPEPTSVGAALTFDETQSAVASLIANKVIVGHSLWNDFSGVLLPFHLSVYFVAHSRLLPPLPFVTLIRI